MIYLDNGATSFPKLSVVSAAMHRALETCANPGRGGYHAALEAMKTVYSCREEAAALFDCNPEQVVFTSNCTHALNIAIRSLVKPKARVLISGFEHNAVTRVLHLLDAQVIVKGRKLFDWDDMLTTFEEGLRSGVDAAVFTHVSNVFGYILPVEKMAALCLRYKVPFVVDAAQSGGILPVSLRSWNADFIALPGHKGLLGPQGTGILLCGRQPQPLIAGGTGNESMIQSMPEYLPERAEAGTLNVPGIAGLAAGMRHIRSIGTDAIFKREHAAAQRCIQMLEKHGFSVFAGDHQSGTVSFLTQMDCEEVADRLGARGIAVRAGLHCAPLAHESVGTVKTGTVRVSFGHDADHFQLAMLERALHGIK